jgi:hypothetical protein
MTSQRFLLIVTFVCSVIGSADPAAAQIFKICGDVDDNDTVTVTDGVQVLRAAAGLSSDCTDAICDVDVNGFPTAGSLTYEFNEDSGMTGIRRAQVFYDGSNLARVLVTFSDGSFKNYRFELQFLNFI